MSKEVGGMDQRELAMNKAAFAEMLQRES